MSKANYIAAGIAVVVLGAILLWKSDFSFGKKSSEPPARTYSKPEVEVMKELSRQEERGKVLYEQQYGK